MALPYGMDSYLYARPVTCHFQPLADYGLTIG
jgi:hypothetical protein